MQIDVRHAWNQLTEDMFNFTAAVIFELLHLKRVNVDGESGCPFRSHSLEGKGVTANIEWFNKPQYIVLVDYSSQKDAS